MPLVFKTRKDDPADTEIIGVGVLPANGKGGIPVEQAALRMIELQEKDPWGQPVLDQDGEPKTLSGSELTAAAKAFAEARGLETTNVSEDKLAGLRVEGGALPELPPAGETSKELGAILYPEQEPVNTDPEKAASGDVTALTPGEGDGKEG